MHVAVTLHAGSRRNQLTDDNVLLQADQRIHLTLDGSFRQNLGGLLEGCRRQEGIGGKRSLRNSQKDLLTVRRLFAFGSQGLVQVLILQRIHQSARQEIGISAFFNADLLQHLTHDHLDVLVADIYALQTVYALYLAEHVILHRTDSLDLQQIMRVHASFCQLVAGFQLLAVHHLDSGAVRNQVCLGFSRLMVGDDDFTLLLGILNHSRAAELRDNRKSLRLSGLKQLLYTGKTLRDIVTRHTAGMEGTHGKLGTGLTDGLCRDDSDRFADLHLFTGRHVGSVALRTDSVMGTAAKNRSDLHLFNGISLFIHANAQNLFRAAGSNHMILLYEHVAIAVTDILTGYPARDTVFQIFNGLLTVHEGADLHAGNLISSLAAIRFTDDQLLGYVNHSSGQVSGVCGTQSGIGKSLTGSVC